MVRPLARRARATACGLALLISASCAAEPPAPPWASALGTDHPLVGRIYVAEERRFITADALAERALARRYLLLGEKHDNGDHHRLQAWLTRRMIASGRRPALVMEMIGAARQADIDAHLRANPFDAPGLGPVLMWDKTGWPAWRHYAPIVQPILSGGLPVIGANLEFSLVRAIARDGYAALGTERRAALALDRKVPAAVTDAVAHELLDAHCGRLSAARARALAPVQIARDAAFAAAMVRATAGGTDGAILIAGAGHVRADRGAPWHLVRQGAARDEALSVAFIEVQSGSDTPEAYAAVYGTPALPFDAVWFTARHSDEDPCKT